MPETKLSPLLIAAMPLFIGCAERAPASRTTTEPIPVALGGAAFATVHVAATPRPYVFPLRAPDGTPVTRAYPMGEVEGESRDHPHHQSLWFAHGDVNGFDFWHGSERAERMELEGEAEYSEVEGWEVVRARYRWLVNESTLVATEAREWRFGEEDGARIVDFTTTLTPSGAPLVLGDTKEGSFALRVHPALRVEGEHATGTLTNSEGAAGRDVWSRRARWIHDVGTIDGRAYGVALLDHPTNLNHPTWWHARTYGLLAANPFGRKAFEGEGSGEHVVALGESLELRYRVLVHGAGWGDAGIEAAWERWAGRN